MTYDIRRLSSVSGFIISLFSLHIRFINICAKLTTIITEKLKQNNKKNFFKIYEIKSQIEDATKRTFLNL